jgi:hypothetical protein
MAIVRIDHGRQDVSSPGVHVIEAHVSTYECTSCRRRLGTSLIDVALENVRGPGFAELEHAAWLRWLEASHRC